MTVKETNEWDNYRAIDLLKRIKREEIHERYIDRHKAFDMEIQALEEVEQYRALGTPTQILERIGGLDVELGKYHCLGTVEELKEAREKQIPKKPKIQRTDDKALLKCPCCDNVLLEEFYGVVTLRHGQITKHCEKCGQALDWSEEDD